MRLYVQEKGFIGFSQLVLLVAREVRLLDQALESRVASQGIPYPVVEKRVLGDPDLSRLYRKLESCQRRSVVTCSELGHCNRERLSWLRLRFRGERRRDHRRFSVLIYQAVNIGELTLSDAKSRIELCRQLGTAQSGRRLPVERITKREHRMKYSQGRSELYTVS